MGSNEILTLFFERSNAMQTFWNFYITIVLGLVGFFAAAKMGKARAVKAAALLTVGFVGFAIVNFSGLRDAATQRVEACLALARLPTNKPSNMNESKLDRSQWFNIEVHITDPLAMTLSPPTVPTVRWFHVASDLGVIATMWFLALREDRQR